MNKRCGLTILLAFLALLLLVGTGCGDSGGTKAGSPPDAEAGAGGGGNDGTGTGGNAGNAGTGAIQVSLSEGEFTLETPDLKHPLTATVSGATNAAVTWSSSNTYIATVSATGEVISVSGGEATITATSVEDATKTASATVTVAEPNRPRAESYTDAASITSGPITIITCGDSLTRTYTSNAVDQTGWGQVLSQFFSSDVTVDNSTSNGGRSSRSFYNESGRWDVVKGRLRVAQAAGKPTFVFIMFGHNDEKKVTDTDGADYLTFASTNPNGTVAGTYYDYLERYIVETRELGGIPVLFTPFVREYLGGTPPTISGAGVHDVTAPYPGEATARGDYPAAAKAIAEKHDVPVIDITSWSKAMVEGRAVEETLPYVYISSDQTHVRSLGALLIAEEAVRALGELGILTHYIKPPAPRLMLDAGALPFGGLYAGGELDKSFRISPFGDVSGTITVTAPDGYSVSTDGETFAASATIECDSSYVGSVVTVRFTPTDAVAYNGALTVEHTSLTPDYGNTAPNPNAGTISLTGNGKVAVDGEPATATWSMFSGTTIVLDPETMGAISARPATLTGLMNKNVANGGARFDTLNGAWPAESAGNPDRYVQFTVPVSGGAFTLDAISVGGGTGGGSNVRWDILYSLTEDFAAPTPLELGVVGAKDTLVMSSYTGLGLPLEAGQTLYLRVYPYSTSAATSGKSLMLANVVVSGVSN